MGIDLQWTDERGNEIETLGDPDYTFAGAIERDDITGTTCLRFIDPYGDTVFNQFQIPILITELEWLLNATDEEKERGIISSYLQLAKHSSGRTHTYLKFVGD